MLVLPYITKSSVNCCMDGYSRCFMFNIVCMTLTLVLFLIGGEWFPVLD